MGKAKSQLLSPVQALHKLIKISREHPELFTDEMIDVIAEAVYRYEELKREFLDKYPKEDDDE